MIEEMKKVRENIRNVIKEINEIKDKNYRVLYNDGDLRYFDEMKRNLYISAANVATFIDHISSPLDMTENGG